MGQAKQQQIETALSRVGAKVALAADELMHAEKELQAASKKLVEVQREIEQIYMTLDEPLIFIDMDEQKMGFEK